MKLKSSETLRAVMRQEGFSGARLARYAGCSTSFIAQLARGDKRTCTPKLATGIVEALGVSLETLFVPNLPSTAGRAVKEGAAA